MFRAAHRSSSGALNCICGLWFILHMWWPAFVKSEWEMDPFPTQPWQRPVTTCVYNPEAANTVYSSWWWAVCCSKHVEPSINFGIINSITRLHLVGYFYWYSLIFFDDCVLYIFFTKYNFVSMTPFSAPFGNTGTLNIASFSCFQYSNSSNLSYAASFSWRIIVFLDVLFAWRHKILFWGLIFKIAVSFGVPRPEPGVPGRSREVWDLLWIMCCEQNTEWVICLLFLLSHDIGSIWGYYRDDSKGTFCWVCYLRARDKYYILYVFS